jgi:transposase
LTGGQAADVSQGGALIEGLSSDAVIADKGYDSDALVSKAESAGAEAVIPPRSNRKESRVVDWYLYKERNHVERFMNRVKHYRRVATRYDKTARNYLTFVHVAAIMLLLR